LLARIEMDDEHKLFSVMNVWPDVIGGEYTEFFHRKALEDRLNVFG